LEPNGGKSKNKGSQALTRTFSKKSSTICR